MKAFIFKGRIRISPVPKEDGLMLYVWLKKPLSKNNKPFVYADIEKGRKYYGLPCPEENINGIVIKAKDINAEMSKKTT